MSQTPAHLPRLNPRQLKKTIVSAWADQLSLKQPHHADTKRRLLELPLLATGRRTSITDAYEKRFGTTNTDVFFDHFRALDRVDVESNVRAMNARILQTAKDCGLLPAKCRLAADGHVDADYTETHDSCIGYKELPGTGYGMAYLSVESVMPNARFTLAFQSIRQATNRSETLLACLEEAQQWTTIEVVLIDREFDNAATYRGLGQRNIPFVIPVKRTKRVRALEQQAWRLRIPVEDSPYHLHVIPNHVVGGEKNKATVNLVFFFEPDSKDKSKDTCFVFATNTTDLTGKTMTELAAHYRERWSIETGYRLKNPQRLRTTTAHHPTRLFLQLFTIPTYNLWTLLRALRARQDWVDHRHMKQGYLQRHFWDDLEATFTA